MFFHDIIGQEKAVGQIRGAIDNNSLPHALLICGREGFGGLALALAAARYLQCTDRHDGEACGKCLSCRQYDKLMHPDLHFVYPTVNKGTSASPSISEDFLVDWRSCVLADPYLTLNDWLQSIGADNKQGIINQADSAAIIHHLCVKPYESDYRVLIIWLPEKMNDIAANKLLKILEEPYEKTHFFMVCQEPNNLLGTILSRAQRLNLPPIDETVLSAALTEKFGCDATTATAIAHLAQGSYVNATAALQQDEEQAYFFRSFCSMMRLSYQRKLQEMKDWSDELSAIGRERQKNFLQYSQRLIRENFIMNFGNPQLNYMSPDEQTFSQRFSPYVNCNNVEGIMQELAVAEEDIAGNVNAKMVFFDLSLKLIMLLKNGNAK